MHRPHPDGCLSPRDNLCSRDDLYGPGIIHGDEIDELDFVIEHHPFDRDDVPTHEKLASSDKHGRGFPHATIAIPFHDQVTPGQFSPPRNLVMSAPLEAFS